MSPWTGIHLSGAPKPAPKRRTLLREAGHGLALFVGYLVAVGGPLAALYFGADRFGWWR